MTRKINVLHILDMVGGSSIQSYFYKKFGYGNSWVLSSKNLHPVIRHYDEVEKLPRVRDVILEGLRRSRKNQIDIIFVHGSEMLVPFFKLFTRKKVILQYHGSDINDPKRSRNFFRIIARSMADTIIYNQKAHLKKIITIKKVKKVYHVNAVDTELFHPANNKKTGIVAFISGNLDKNATKKILSKFDGIEIIDTEDAKIPYEEIPEILNRYEMLVDLKITDYGLLVPTLSKLALQALACGCKVHTFEGKIKDSLPERHKPEIVMKKLYDLFSEVI